MNIKNWWMKGFVRRGLRTLEAVIYHFGVLKENTEIAPFIKMLVNAYDGIKDIYKEKYPNVKVPEILTVFLPDIVPVDINNIDPYYVDWYKEFKDKYVTKIRDYPIEFTGSEIYDIMHTYKNKSNTGYIFDKFIQTYFTGTRKLNMNGYYMLIEHKYKTHISDATMTISIIPIRLPSLCKRTYGDFELIKYYNTPEKIAIPDMFVYYEESGKELKRIIFMFCNFVYYNEKDGKPVSEIEKRLFQAYINGYNKYVVDMDLIQNELMYRYWFSMRSTECYSEPLYELHVELI